MVQAREEPLAELWGIRNQDIPLYLEREKFLASGDGIIKQFLPNSSFGRSYIDVIKNEIIINTVNQSMIPYIRNESQIQPYLDVLSFKPVTKSLETLQTSLDQIFDLANVNDVDEAIFGLFPEENNNIIYMYEESKEINQAFINAVEQYGPKIIFHPREISLNTEISINKRNLDILLLGGDGLFNQVKRRSIGFLAKAKNETKNYIVTVEHCRKESGDDTEFFYGAWNKPRTNELVGPMLSDVNEHYDFGLIDLSNMSKSLKTLPAIRNADSEQFPELYINDDGVHLCKSGYTTHVTCGFVKAFDVIYYAGDGEFDSGLIMTSMDGQDGDSGGTVFAYSNLNTVILNGILVYAIGNINTMILPLNMIIEHGNVEPITASNI
ncbi:hypothetical protein F8M41_019680 [Gigaspora margarita]|uniref:Uncharacterized protein n=1 Tax=Gigaspora margarita TaxID=4874 RepID=A0A8H4AJR6_GIGMA|nr:hypothetical protein F8M41_019680 [Gigaspora margarita]